MAYDERLGERIATLFAIKGIDVQQKKMFGGLCFLLDNKMCIGVIKNSLMARIGPEKYVEALSKIGCSEMDFTGRALKGYVYIDSSSIEEDGHLEYWLNLCIDFNPLAKSSRKKKKK